MIFVFEPVFSKYFDWESGNGGCLLILAFSPCEKPLCIYVPQLFKINFLLFYLKPGAIELLCLPLELEMAVLSASPEGVS